MIKNKIESYKVDFHFENGIDDQIFAKYEFKIQRFIDNSNLATNAAIFAERNEISVILSVDTSNAFRNEITKFENRLTRLIDSHKEAATYQWSNRELTQKSA